MKKNEDELVERENVTVNKLFEENSKGGHNAKINYQPSNFKILNLRHYWIFLTNSQFMMID